MIGLEQTGTEAEVFHAFNPREGKPMEPAFYAADSKEVERALALAEAAAPVLRNYPAEKIAGFLVAVADEIMALGDSLLERASQESGLDMARLTGERGRTTNQLKMFAEVVREGSWLDARIETALPDRKPLPRPDLRRMLRAIGPVAVFGASNFPLAFSVAGGDTASAFAAGNPVVVKGHPAHPGTSALVAAAIERAIKTCGFPEGTFALLQGASPELSIALVSHPAIKAVGFTGSERAGRALFDAAAKRPEPIPVYAEMGSVNPLFILPQAMAERGIAIAEGLFKSVTTGQGQFCTCPGLAFIVQGAGVDTFTAKLFEQFKEAAPGTMLNPNVAKLYEEYFQRAAVVPGVDVHRSSREAVAQHTEGRPSILSVDAETWMNNVDLQHEIFGPATILIRCQSVDQMIVCSHHLAGSLTATMHATAEELAKFSQLTDILSTKAGRLVFNGYPTGVEVGSAMNHGGPYPATTDSKFTSVGTTAILRFARPVCYQNFPETLLPVELRNANERGIWRRINGTLTQGLVVTEP
jgi:NADP-dependent aldehyde dehydrogenase